MYDCWSAHQNALSLIHKKKKKKTLNPCVIVQSIAKRSLPYKAHCFIILRLFIFYYIAENMPFIMDGMGCITCPVAWSKAWVWKIFRMRQKKKLLQNTVKRWVCNGPEESRSRWDWNSRNSCKSPLVCFYTAGKKCLSWNRLETR